MTMIFDSVRWDNKPSEHDLFEDAEYLTTINFRKHTVKMYHCVHGVGMTDKHYYETSIEVWYGDYNLTNQVCEDLGLPSLNKCSSETVEHVMNFILERS